MTSKTVDDLSVLACDSIISATQGGHGGKEPIDNGNGENIHSKRYVKIVLFLPLPCQFVQL